MHLLIALQLVAPGSFAWVTLGSFDSEGLCLNVGRALGSYSQPDFVKRMVCVPTTGKEASRKVEPM